VEPEETQPPKNLQQINLAKGASDPKEPAIPASQVKAFLAQIEISRHQFSGPLPPPEILKEYNDILPGLADRVMKMAEKQSTHRQKIEDRVIGSDAYRANAGLWIGAGVAVLSILAGAYLVAIDHDWAGVGIGTTVVVALVGVFVYGSISRRQERLSKSGVPEQNQPQSASDLQRNPPGEK
jgi:uncharacterized membrane protein